MKKKVIIRCNKNAIFLTLCKMPARCRRNKNTRRRLKKNAKWRYKFSISFTSTAWDVKGRSLVGVSYVTLVLTLYWNSRVEIDGGVEHYSVTENQWFEFSNGVVEVKNNNGNTITLKTKLPRGMTPDMFVERLPDSVHEDFVNQHIINETPEATKNSDLSTTSYYRCIRSVRACRKTPPPTDREMLRNILSKGF